MSLDVDLIKIRAGAKEIFKVGVNFAEEELENNLKESGTLLRAGLMEYKDVVEEIKHNGKVFYNEKTEKMKEFYEENFGTKFEEVEEKYLKKLDELIDSKINELKGYQK